MEKLFQPKKINNSTTKLCRLCNVVNLQFKHAKELEMKALVLSGGGARGAYQVGVLTAVAELANQHKIKSPFKIYTGISAGAINAGYLASGAEDFSLCVQKLTKMWSEISSDQVFKTDAISLGKIGLQWMGELSFGALKGTTPTRSLLDTSPLLDLIKHNLEFSKIQANIESNALHALAITALDYRTSNAITFVQGEESIKNWERSRRKSEKCKIDPEHILASSAIPLLFPPIQVDERWFGDGCVRNQTPCSPALHLGAEQLFVIGVRKLSDTADDLRALQLKSSPSVARVINVLLNSILLDGIEVDIERMKRVNDFLDRVPDSIHENLNFKKINYVWIHPTEDIGNIASRMSSKLPRVIRYLLKGLGPLEDASEIISYLLFEPEFCSKLIEIGYQDGMADKMNIEKFLLS